MTKADADYAAWESKVDSIIQKSTGGLRASDLPDTNYRDFYDAGQSPEEVAQELLVDNGFETGCDC